MKYKDKYIKANKELISLRQVKRKMKQVTTLRSDDNLSYYLDGLSIIKTAKANDVNISIKSL